MSRLGPTAGLYKPVFAAPSGAGLRAPKPPESALAPTGLESMQSPDVDAAVGRLRALASELGAAPPEPEQASTRPYIAFSPSSKQMFVNGFTFAENDATRALESEQYLGQSAQRPETGDWQRIPASVYQDYLQSIRDPSAGTRFAKSFSSGVGSLQQLWGAALMAATDGGAGQDLYEAGGARMERLQPFAKKFSEVKNLDDAGDFMVSLLGSQAPNILESITTALIGAGIGAGIGATGTPVGAAAGGLGGFATGVLAKGAVKDQLKAIAQKKLIKGPITPDEEALWKREAGRTGAAIQLAARKKAAGDTLSVDEQKLIRQGAAVTGALTLSTLENYGIGVGDIYGEMLEKGVADEPGARAAAFGYAVPYAALSTAPEFLGALALFRPTKSTGLKAAAGRFGTGLAVGAAGEGVSEASQEGLIMGVAEGFGAQYTPQERGERLLEAGVAGAALGGITGGPINLLRRPERDAGITPPAAPTAPAEPAAPPIQMPTSPYGGAILDDINAQLIPDTAGRVDVAAQIMGGQMPAVLPIAPQMPDAPAPLAYGPTPVTRPVPSPSYNVNATAGPLAPQRERDLFVNRPVTAFEPTARPVPSPSYDVNTFVQPFYGVDPDTLDIPDPPAQPPISTVGPAGPEVDPADFDVVDDAPADTPAAAADTPAAASWDAPFVPADKPTKQRDRALTWIRKNISPKTADKLNNTKGVSIEPNAYTFDNVDNINVIKVTFKKVGRSAAYTVAYDESKYASPRAFAKAMGIDYTTLDTFTRITKTTGETGTKSTSETTPQPVGSYAPKVAEKDIRAASRKAAAEKDKAEKAKAAAEKAAAEKAAAEKDKAEKAKAAAEKTKAAAEKTKAEKAKAAAEKAAAEKAAAKPASESTTTKKYFGRKSFRTGGNTNVDEKPASEGVDAQEQAETSGRDGKDDTTGRKPAGESEAETTEKKPVRKDEADVESTTDLANQVAGMTPAKTINKEAEKQIAMIMELRRRVAAENAETDPGFDYAVKVIDALDGNTDTKRLHNAAKKRMEEAETDPTSRASVAPKSLKKNRLNENMVKEVIDQIRSKLNPRLFRGLDTVYVKNMEDFKNNHKRLHDLFVSSRKEQGDAKTLNPSGLYLTDGKGKTHIIMFTDNISNKNHAVRVFVEEVVAHHGMRAVLGSEFDTVLQKIYDENPDIQSLAARYQQAQDSKLSILEATEEVLAKELANQVSTEIIPPGIVTRLMNSIKRLLNKVFGKETTGFMDIQDVFALFTKVKQFSDPAADMRYKHNDGTPITIKKELNAILMSSEYGDVSADERNGAVVLRGIKVNENNRRKGYGTDLLQALADYAFFNDENNPRVFLSDRRVEPAAASAFRQLAERGYWVWSNYDTKTNSSPDNDAPFAVLPPSLEGISYSEALLTEFSPGRQKMFRATGYEARDQKAVRLEGPPLERATPLVSRASVASAYQYSKAATPLYTTGTPFPSDLADAMERVKDFGINSSQFMRDALNSLKTMNFSSRSNPGYARAYEILTNTKNVISALRTKYTMSLEGVLQNANQEERVLVSDMLKFTSDAKGEGLTDAQLRKLPTLFKVVGNQLVINKEVLADLKKQGRFTLEDFKQGRVSYKIEEKKIVDGEDVSATRTETLKALPDLTENSPVWRMYEKIRDTMDEAAVDRARADYAALFGQRNNAFDLIEDLTKKTLTDADRKFIDEINTLYKEISMVDMEVDDRGRQKHKSESLDKAQEFMADMNRVLIAKTEDKDRVAAFTKYFPESQQAAAADKILALRKDMSFTKASVFEVQQVITDLGMTVLTKEDSELNAKRNIVGGYTPVGRQGRWQVRILAKDPKTGEVYGIDQSFRDQLMYSQLEDRASATRLADSINKMFAEGEPVLEMPVNISGKGETEVRSVRLIAVSEAARETPSSDPAINLSEFMRLISRYGVGLTPEERKRLVTGMTDQNARVRANLEKKGVPGSDPNSIPYISQHLESLAAITGNRENQHMIDALMDDRNKRSQKLWNADDTKLAELKENYDKLTADPNTNPKQLEVLKRALDHYAFMVRRTQEEGGGNIYKDRFSRDLDYLRGRNGMEHTDFGSSTTGQAIRTWTAVMQLGLSPATAALSLVSVPLNVLPLLASYNKRNGMGGGFGFPRASTALFTALKDTGGQGKHDVRYYDNLLAKEEALAASGLTKIEAEFIREQIKSGSFQASLSNALTNSAKGRFGRSPEIQAVIDTIMSMFTAMEQYSRRASGLAAFRLELERQLEAGVDEKTAIKRATEFGVTITDTGLGNYNMLNRPGLFRDGLREMIFMYKMYPIVVVQLVSSLDRKGQAMMLLGLFLVSGLKGLPFAENIMDLLDTIFQRLGFKVPSVEAWATRELDKLVPGLTPIIMRGVLDNILPATISSRTGVGNLIPGTSFMLAGSDPYRELVDVLGPAASAMSGSFDTGTALLQGSLSAVGIGNREVGLVDIARDSPITMLRALGDTVAYAQTDAIVDRKGYVSSYDLNAMTYVTRLAGFYPSAATRQSDVTRLSKQEGDYVKAVSEEFRNRYVKAALRNDRAAMSRVLEDVRDWNEASQGTGLQINNFPINARRALQEARKTGSERFESSAPKALRQNIEELREAVGADE